MNSRMPTPKITERGKKICPVCGKSSYSAGGVHPQCAVHQADEELRAQQKAKGEDPPQDKNSVPRSWEKRCPKCKAVLHVRKQACDCGHTFGK